MTDDLELLTKALRTLDDRLVTCMRCGLCQAVCPVYGASLMEADVTRGKIALLRNLAYRLIESPEDVDEKLRRCLLCGACESQCPSGVRIVDIFLDARHIVSSFLTLSPVKKVIFRALLPNPKLFNALLGLARPLQGFMTVPGDKVQGTETIPALNSVLGSRQVPPLAPQSLQHKVGVLNSPMGKSRLKVAFYPGCLVDKVYPGLGEACLKVFDHHGVGVFYPKDLTCCGLPALASGDRSGFEQQVRHNVDILRRGNFDYIVMPCASCTVALRDRWAERSGRLPSVFRDAINELAAKAIDINAFLVNVVKVRPAGQFRGTRNRVKTTYHEPCHLRFGLGVRDEPRRLLRLNGACDLVEMAESDRCCGCGGTFTLDHYETSQQIGDRKRANILASGAQEVATACPACMMQLSERFAAHGDPIRVRHVIEVYADSL